MKNETHTFRLWVAEPGDFSVGIPSAEGPITITVPDWLVPEGDEESFAEGLAKYLEGWTDMGKVLTSKEKLKMDQDEYLREKDFIDSELP